ncbi:MAG: hypothetical protein OXL34_02830 [Gemmatimonadota bacterium]|nr:hypothetical protein [Gemmatimonadota bacterium]
MSDDAGASLKDTLDRLASELEEAALLAIDCQRPGGRHNLALSRIAKISLRAANRLRTMANDTSALRASLSETPADDP